MRERENKPSPLRHVSRPLIRLKGTFQAVEPLDGPVEPGPLLPVRRPLVRLKGEFPQAMRQELLLEIGIREGVSLETVMAKVTPVFDLINHLSYRWETASSQPGRAVFRLTAPEGTGDGQFQEFMKHLKSVFVTVAAAEIKDVSIESQPGDHINPLVA